MMNEPSVGNNFLAAVVRRWPWLVIGVVIGTLGGFLMLYLSRAPLYQSTAQVLVVKKRDMISGSNDTRMAYLEDYVATQVTLIKSERIMLEAAKKIKPGQITMYLPEDETARGKYLSAMLTVAREKDAMAQTGGTNVLNLAYRGPNAEDCQTILTIIIETYKKELESVYDDETTRSIKLYEQMINQISDDVTKLQTTRLENYVAINKITPEVLTVIQSRISKQLDMIGQYELEKLDNEGKLKLVKQAGADPRNRALVVAQLADPGRGVMPNLGRVEVDNPEQAAKLLEMEKAELAKKYRDGHPQMESLDARISYLKNLAKERIVPGATAGLDALTVFEDMIKNRIDNLQKLIELTKANLDQDVKKATEARSLQVKVEDADRLIAEKGKQIEEYRTKKNQNEVTKSSGGFAANVLTRPNIDPVPISPKLTQ
ncbi:MAG: GumC family protein, partial [Gemmataceae bacterium]